MILIYIYIYIYIYTYILLLKAVPPWATETVLSPWLAADEDRVSHVLSHVVWWKFKKYIAFKSVCIMKYSKILKKVTSLSRMMSVTVEFVTEEVNIW